MLNKNWLTDSHIDLEYKQYVLLAYLEEVKKNFRDNKLYPPFAELIEHYQELIRLKENSLNLFEKFPERMAGIDNDSLRLIYQKIIENDEIMNELQKIIDYSIPKLKKHVEEGKKIYDLIEEKISIQPVGITPLNSNEGYMLLKLSDDQSTSAYQYKITIFESASEKFRGINIEHVKSYEKSFSNTFENIKIDLITFHSTLPNPATFAIETEMSLPVEETYLPIAKRSLVKYVSTQTL
jgi:hypothetical protein